MALLTHIPGGPLPSADFLRRCLTMLPERGYERALTGALSPSEQGAYVAAGFELAEPLRLLVIDLGRPLPAAAGLRLSRPRAGDRAAVLALDAGAFDQFWRLDDTGLDDALAATRRSRWRVALPDGPGRSVCGYAICGRSGRTGFVQRLAVADGHRGRGHGRALLVDGLAWMRRHGARRALVNTQVGNERALGLYRAVGFEEDPSGLAVMAADLS